MIVTVYGGSGSGKSEFAENLTVQLDKGEKIYLATMKAFGEETLKKIQKHKQLREGKNFLTLELEENIRNGEKVLREFEKSNGTKPTVLLECMSNLAANEMFDSSFSKTENLALKIFSDVKYISGFCKNLVIVTNNIFEDGTEYEKETVAYMKLLSEINRKLCNASDKVYEVVVGIPLLIKEI